MGFLNDLITTYDSVMGHEPDGMEKIAPVAHQYRNPSQIIDVTINKEGKLTEPKFKIDKKCNERTLIAMTEDSSSTRTGLAAAVTPHGMNDKLMFMTKRYEHSYEAYTKQLQEWCDSEDSCIQAQAVLKYITTHDIVDDMLSGNYLPSEKDGTIKVDKYKDYIVRWRVLVNGDYAETWKNKQTLNSWTAFYTQKHFESLEHTEDSIDGSTTDVEVKHPAPISAYGMSKLISISNDEKNLLNFTGERFTDEKQLPKIGYENSQKLHNALGWLIDTQGIPISKNTLPWCRTDKKPKYLVCWRPEIPQDESSGFQLGLLMGRKDLNKIPKYSTYVSQMKKLIVGTGSPQFDNKKISMFMIDRSSKGRFSPVMYRSFTALEFIEKIREWHDSCSWYSYAGQSAGDELTPVSLFEIAKCAYGVQRFNKSDQPYLDVDDSVFKDTVNVLLSSVIDGRNIPDSLMQRLTAQVMPERFAGNKGHEMQLFNEILRTACGLLHWIHMRKDKEKGASCII